MQLGAAKPTRALSIMAKKTNIFWEITHLSVIAFKEGTFGFCLQLKD
jgi:hypothetical protein